MSAVRSDEIEPGTEGGARRWRARAVKVEVDGAPRTVRLVRFARGWLASADTVDGPTLGADASPYLAVRRALEPLGVGLVAAMTAVGPIHERHAPG